MIDVKAERLGVPRKAVLAATFGVPAGLLIFVATPANWPGWRC